MWYLSIPIPHRQRQLSEALLVTTIIKVTVPLAWTAHCHPITTTR